MNHNEQFIFGYHNLDNKGERFDPKNVSNPQKSHTALIRDMSSPSIFTPKVFNPISAAADVLSTYNDDQSPKDLLIHIHGYNPNILVDLPGNYLNLKLFKSQCKNYLTEAGNHPLKMMYFSWASKGKSHREINDDRGLRLGKNLYDLRFLDQFAEFAFQLSNKNIRLNLMVHSFGNHLLNGLLSKESIERDSIFNHIFLMAPDIPQQSVCLNNPNHNGENGITVKNHYFNNNPDYAQITYDLTKLRHLANKIHVFYDRYDYLLYKSVEKQMPKNFYSDLSGNERKKEIEKYLTLGNMGNKGIENRTPQNFEFYDLNSSTFNDAPYPPQTAKRGVEKFHKNYDFKYIKGDFWLTLNSTFSTKKRRATQRHRYFAFNKKVVKAVLGNLKQ